MELFRDVILSLFPIAVGMIVLNALLSFIYNLSGGRWRELALAYPMPESRVFTAPAMVRFFEMVEIYEGDGDAKGQIWWVIARIYADGLTISTPPLPGLSSYPSIFIPLSDLRVERRPWRMRNDAAAIAAPRAPALSIMIGDTLASVLEALCTDTSAAAPGVNGG